ncbi:Uncharacterized protein FWK35_00027217 [Aphis craccivora]|uniref:Uncharacterized protein n=1 Tax=Aphis craccivora TaxID=307492 RepID=A0A6G0W1Q9_APHCR|nr:Uncharacterized protein FWK35_00027217 [Aphis craccivora]
MAEGHTAITSGTATFEARIDTILDSLYCGALLGHYFLVYNQASWDFAACTIHMGRQIRTSTCWKGKA